MTREEAIEVIKDIYNYTKWDTYTTNEARTMAIKALEQELCNDSISRKEVLQMIDNIREAGGFIGFNTYSEAFDQVNNMSSVPRWIPVSERLPQEHICDDGYHEPSDYVLVYMESGLMHVSRWWSRFDERWVDLKYPTTDEVIAWMPLPEPYKAESEDI